MRSGHMARKEIGHGWGSTHAAIEDLRFRALGQRMIVLQPEFPPPSRFPAPLVRPGSPVAKDAGCTDVRRKWRLERQNAIPGATFAENR